MTMLYVFFTGAYVGLTAVDYSGYASTAEFDYFDYKELGAHKAADGTLSWQKSKSRFYEIGRILAGEP